MMDIKDVKNSIIADKNPVSWIQEICIKDKTVPIYTVNEKRTKPALGPMFEVQLSVDNYGGQNLVVIQTANSKKLAKQYSALSMLNMMGLTKSDLEQISMIKNLGSVFEWKSKEMETSNKCGADVTKNENPTGVMFESTLSNNSFISPKPSEVLMEQSQIQEVEKVSTDINSTENYVGTLMEFCTRNMCTPPKFETITQTGPSHLPTFTMSCTVKKPGIAQPFVSEITKNASLKTIKKILAYEMLEKLHMDSNSSTIMKPSLEQRPIILDKDLDTVTMVKQLNGLKLNTNVPSSICSSSKSSFTHQPSSTNDDREKLPYEILQKIKELISDWKYVSEDALDFLDEVCVKLRDYGIKANVENTVRRNQMYESYLELRICKRCIVHRGSAVSEKIANNISANAAIKTLSELE